MLIQRCHTPVSVESPYKLIEKTVKNILNYNREHDEPERDTDIKTGKGIKAVNSLARYCPCMIITAMFYSSSAQKNYPEFGSICEMGTFIKNILVLPILKHWVQYNPSSAITEIGVYGKKGNLGSPFAIRDSFLN
jgi:hypothetical protein